jgi:hypothetical protein
MPPLTGDVGDADHGDGWLVSPAMPGCLKSLKYSSTRDTSQQLTVFWDWPSVSIMYE